MSHNLTAPSLLPLTIVFPSGDNAILASATAPSPSRQSPQILCRSPSSTLAASHPMKNINVSFWRGIITDISFILVVDEYMLQNSSYRAQRYLSFHPSHSKTITYEDNNDRRTWIAGNNGRFCQELNSLLPDIASWTRTKWHPDEDPGNQTADNALNSAKAATRRLAHFKNLKPTTSKHLTYNPIDVVTADMPNNDSSSSTLTQTNRINRKTTASKPLFSTSKSIEDHATGLGVKTDVNNLNNARKTLTMHGLNLPTAGRTLLAISAALFEFSTSANLGATHTDIIRAFAFIIYEVQKDIDTEHIIEKVKALMGGPVATLDEKVDALEDVLVKYNKEMEKTVTEGHDNIQTTVEELAKAAKSASANPPRHSQTTSDIPGSNGPRSYAAVTKSNTSPLLTKALAKSEAQSRQILIDRRSPLYANSLKDLTEAQLVAKATVAIKLITKDNEDNEDMPKSLVFLSAQRLPHGGVLYKLDSAESTLWFNNPANKSKFLEHFGVEVVIKDRAYHVLIENVPISFVPDNHAAIDDVEKKAGLKPKSICKARYIKPLARRNPGQ
ncbi:hypothetical protein DFJ58DRAFT_746220 [Suillus subalutaceus]|uniref:uncharacterized protein n=1 Tax=Suillus subalutaceus TaxID=48586 RepID=UPI001B866993|nr:uncharacterized protein DFJ58DRAFT_746220 [Suillus subalutaceus]KAG1851878.1 hypothetical protein DFJ58DRAFT_746220 [Suillus subalutaceus]